MDAAVVCLLNQQRAKHGLPPLSEQAQLNTSDPVAGLASGPATWTVDFGLATLQSAPSQDWGPANGCPY
jgi:hypothetical protein